MDIWTERQNKQNKVILMLGDTGAGKTTLINTMINHLLGVKFEDQEFYQITEETDELLRTSEITVYEVFVEENPTSLTIIDTPGYAHTEGYKKDKEVAEYLAKIFADVDGVHYIDAVCFVMKASQNRLSGKEFYIFHSVLSLFGKDIENNIMFLLTHSDGGPPADALNAIDKAEIPCRRDEDNEPVHFLFNNRQKEKRAKQYEQKFKASWEMGERSMNEFFTLLEEKNRKSVQMTLDVLQERTRLEACVSNLRERITEKELKINELSEIQEALRQNRDKIKNCENFVITVEKCVKEKVLIENEWWWNSKVTCCSVCEENCHEWGCWWVNDPSWCSAMRNNYCTMCTGKCHYSNHIKEDKKYKMTTKTSEISFVDFQRDYESTGVKSDDKTYETIKTEHENFVKESESITKIEEKVKRDLNKIKTEKSKMLNQTFVSIMILSKIALKADSAFTLQHLAFLIPKLKEEEGKEEWVKNLEDLKKATNELENASALQYLSDFHDSLIQL